VSIFPTDEQGGFFYISPERRLGLSDRRRFCRSAKAMMTQIAAMLPHE
jgi:hypothetical protein